MTDAKITLHDMANNMLIDVYHPIPEKELLAITLLQDELPSEISFCVPEAYHKKIIGVGGKNIQKFMKKHGVYVKFANQAEHQKIGGYYALKDNVIARTPAKNESALYDLKNDIIELIEDKDNEEMHVSQLIPVARELIPMVFGTDAATIEEIQIQTKTKIMIPLSNLAQEGIIVVGLSKNIQSVLSSILVSYFNTYICSNLLFNRNWFLHASLFQCSLHQNCSRYSHRPHFNLMCHSYQMKSPQD